MIRLPYISLSESARKSLHGYQAEIDELPTYKNRVEAAKRLFSNRNRPSNPTFREVRSKLRGMCQGPRRCGYCEDSYADEIEHIRPKALYPEQVFIWENYLYSCGPCNGPKNNQFKVFDRLSDLPVDVSRSKNAPITPPPPGDYVLIDPRVENPLDYIILDLKETFFFVEIAEAGSRDYERAKYTIEILRLNDRDALIKARRSAYQSFVARLFEYREMKKSGMTPDELEPLSDGIKTMHHQTVWAEIKRQRNNHLKLSELFEDIPEALDW